MHYRGWGTPILDQCQNDNRPEKEIQNEILDYLRVCPAIHRAWQNDTKSIRGRRIVNRFRPAGLPDIIGSLKGGRALFIEVKKKGGMVSHEQRKFIESENKNGAVAFVARSLEQVIERLQLEGVIA